MTEQRKEKIVNSLKSGNKIIRSWSGSNNNGRIVNKLEGIKLLRESEVEELRLAKIIVPFRVVGEYSPFTNYTLNK